MGAEVTPRDKLDQNADSLIPAIGHVIRPSPVRLEILEPGYEGWLISFDGDTKKSDRWGSAECILWKLLSWDVVQARGFRLADVAVNEAEYHDMIEGSKMALERGISEVVIVGDSRIAIQRAESLIQCLKPMLRILLSEFEDQRQKSMSIELAQLKRGFNAAADYLTPKIWTTRHSDFIDNPVELAQLRRLSCNAEKLISDQKSTQAEPAMEPSSVPDANVDVGRSCVSLAQTDERFSPKSMTFVIIRSCTRAEETPAEVEVVDPGSNVRDAAETAEVQARFIPMQAGDELPEPNAQ
ncbi:hypothetical protein PF002_g24326 [Phytophthora fragariae]|uniref:RNase H type-1 domain-containing protein n=1 Tax=Phytophthora fragariae TaxID=53985 RepID=A0A6A3DXQ5_9STRA|nr:hypothetical protein PF003_g10224 [Phytophthora fragariae]KAE8925905.1 hypothetical protein PF009_g23894 [Phytophthora fragariae]KAE9079078.1 hypothetical protein PF007_g23599 [Phytophthora fragariae]KAE9192010.1 hypothetical protein PF002_g24326 [Phytophthora fragariae]KAE9283690.1 hypothetical protein PF001_g22732 [Phytophthora fragariae]